MNLHDYLSIELQSMDIRLPKGKTLEDLINLFIHGARKTGWSSVSAIKVTDQFKEKQKGRNRHYVWFLEHRNLKYCNKCSTVLPMHDFHTNKSRRDGKATQCRYCYGDYQRENPWIYSAGTAKYKAAKLKATPSWVDHDKIREVYSKCPKGYEVDHIIPLQGKKVCGLHVDYNLQYLTESDNSSKGNKLLEE